MAHEHDWIPNGQENFFAWSVNYVSGIDENSAALNLTSEVVTDLKTAQAAYVTQWEALAAAGQSHANSVAKKDLHDERRAAVRVWHNKNLRYNDGLTDTIRARCGIPIPDRTPTPHKIGSHKVGFELLPAGAFQLGIRCWDLDSGDKKIISEANGIVVLFAVSASPLTAIADLTQSILITRVNHTLTFPDTDRGKWVSVSCLWQSTTGDRGAESPIQTAVVP